MPLVIPSGVINYASPLNAVPLDWTGEPPEGAKGIQCAITWSLAEAGINSAVYLNMQNNATLNFSKIRAIVVDNSLNGSDVQVVFPDTETTFTIPAYTPYAVIPVFTNQTQFYMLSPNSLVTDKTAFMILNTLPPPIAVPVTQAQNFAAAQGIDANAAVTRQLVAAGINGTLEGIVLSGFMYGSATGGTITISLDDGAGNKIMTWVFGTGINGFQNFPLTGLDGMQVRFVNGLSLNWTLANAPNGTFLGANVYYRTP